MDENNQPVESWREAFFALEDIPEEYDTPVTSGEVPEVSYQEENILETPAAVPEEAEPLSSGVSLGDTQPVPVVSESGSGQTEELQRILGELQSMEQEQAAASAEADTETFKDDDFREAFGEGDELLHVFNDEPMATIPPQNTPRVSEEEKEEEGPVEKGRPKRKKGYGLFGLPHLAATAVWVILILTIGISIGRLGWLCAADVLALGRDPISATVVIEKDDSLDVIANKLKEAGLIKYPGVFKLYADFTDADESIKPGTYFFPDVNEQQQTIVYDYMALVAVLSPSGNVLEVVEDLRIPEGYTCAQIFKLLEEKGVCKAADLEEFIAGLHLPESEEEEADPLTQYWFLEGVNWGDKYSLEGYLFPDTYDFYVNDTPERVVKKMLEAFDHAFTDVMRAKLEKVEGYSIREIIIIASMIEKEAAGHSESFMVSSVIYNRLAKPAEYPYLNIDATIVYALGGKSDLTAEDLQIDHPYNTYTNKGLPPGPISSPSQNSIAAAIPPQETYKEDENGNYVLDKNGNPIQVYYYYYALNPSTNLHKFSQTYKEHQEFLDSLKEKEVQ